MKNNIQNIRLHKDNNNEVQGVFFTINGKNAYDYLDWLDISIADELGLTTSEKHLVEMRGMNNSKYFETEEELEIIPFEAMTNDQLKGIIELSIASNNGYTSDFFDLYKSKVKERAISIAFARLNNSLLEITNEYKYNQTA